MNRNEHPHDQNIPPDDDAGRLRRIDANPPYGPMDAVEQFRKLLAELIARSVISERRQPPKGPSDEKE
jgi:hypothetical protein